MLMQGPEIESGKVIHALTNHIDLAPTILEYAKAEFDDTNFDGLSLRPIISGVSEKLRDYNFGEYHPSAKHRPYDSTG